MNMLNKPAPKWYRITKKVWSNTENLVIGILLITGHTDSSISLLIFKLVSSFIKDNLDTILVSDTEEYAPKAEVVMNSSNPGDKPPGGGKP